MHQDLLPGLLKEYGDRVVFIYKDFPLAEIHPWATRAAVNAISWRRRTRTRIRDFTNYMHANQKEVNSEKSHDGQFAALDRIAIAQGQKHNLDGAKLQACLKAQQDDRIKASVHEGGGIWAWKLPPTMFINGEKVDGALPIDDLRAVLDRALEQAGQTQARRILPRPHPAQRSRGAESILKLTMGLTGPSIHWQCGGPDLKIHDLLRHSLVALFAVSLLIFSASCTSKRPGDDVAATVDGRKIYKVDVATYFRTRPPAPTRCRSASRPPACASVF